MSTHAAPQAELPAQVSHRTEVLYVQLAREIAMDIQPLEKILAARQISHAEYEEIFSSPRFQALYRKMLDEWESSLNTSERVKIKALSFVEEAMPEFFARAHDAREALPAKVEILKAVSKIAGVDGRQQAEVGGGEKFSVTINMGGDATVKIEKDITPRQPVIDVEDA